MPCITEIKKILLVSNMGDDSISVINVESREESYRIQLTPLESKSGSLNSAMKKPRIGPHSLRIDKKNNIYSVNCFDDSITVIDACTMKAKESIFAGNHPNDMILGLDESYLYVTNGDSDSVSIIDISNKKIIGQISVGVMPHGICISPNDEYIYVANMDSDSISIIDTWSNSKVGCIKVGRCPIEVISSKDGRYLYVTCSYLGLDKKGLVSVISTSSFKVIKNIEVGEIPVQMLLSKDNNNLYVANMGSNDIYIVDLNKFTIKGRVKTGNMTRGIIAGDNDEIFITNSQDNNVSILKENNLQLINSIEVGFEPTSMLYIDKTTNLVNQ